MFVSTYVSYVSMYVRIYVFPQCEYVYMFVCVYVSYVCNVIYVCMFCLRMSMYPMYVRTCVRMYVCIMYVYTFCV